MDAAAYGVRHMESLSLQRLYAKIAWRLVPLLGLGYFIAYLDRVNVGFAKLTMLADLHMSEAAFGLGAGLFFLGYVLFETPSNLLLERIGARVWITRIMVSWGILSAMCMFVTQAWHFNVLRFLIGVAEAGFLPGVLYYLSQWFPAHRRGRIYSLFLLGLPIAGILGAPLSGWIMRLLDGSQGLAGWRWLFLVEGLPALAIGAVILWTLPNRPAEARWLSEAERGELAHALAKDHAGDRPHSFWEGVRNIRVWLLGLIDFGILLTTYALAFWLPTFFRNAGLTDPVQIGLYTAIPNVAALLGMLGLGYSSDMRRERRWHLMGPFLVGIVAILFFPLVDHNLALLLLVTTVASAAITGAVPVFFSLPATFLNGPAAAAGFAVACSVANLAGLIGNTIIGLSLSLTGSAAAAMIPFAFFLMIGVMVVKSLPPDLVNR